MYDEGGERNREMFGDRALLQISNPRNEGRHETATHVGRAGARGDGPYIYLWFTLHDGTVKDASYECNGCPSSIACAGLLSEIAKGRVLSCLKELTSQELLLLLGGLPEGKGYYADLAISALATTSEILEDDHANHR